MKLREVLLLKLALILGKRPLIYIRNRIGEIGDS